MDQGSEGGVRVGKPAEQMTDEAFHDAVVRLYASAVLDGLRSLAAFDIEEAAYHMAKASLLAQAITGGH